MPSKVQLSGRQMVTILRVREISPKGNVPVPLDGYIPAFQETGGEGRIWICACARD